MRDIRIAAAQFEAADGIKEYNLAQIKRLAKDAVALGAEVVSFHEMSITGYSFLQDATREKMLSIAEFVPAGPSCVALHEIAFELNVPILAGLLEVEKETGAIYNTYVCAHPTQGIVASHRKLHAFLNPHLSSGDKFTVFELLGCKCGILICYDNNIAENVRCTALEGCEILFAPHVTGCAPGPASSALGIADPRRSAADVALWTNRREDPVPLRMQLHGPSGRGWVMRWLPARAYDNNLFVVFTNPIGMDDGVLRHGNSLVVDPFGEVVAECVELGDAVIVAFCAAEKRDVASGGRYLRARRPELYGRLTAPNPTTDTVQEIGPGWIRRAPSDAPYSAAAVIAAEAQAAVEAARAEEEGVPPADAPRRMPKPARTPRDAQERPPRRLSVENLMAALPGSSDGESMYAKPVSMYDDAAQQQAEEEEEEEEDDPAEAAEMAAAFGSLGGGAPSGGSGSGGAWVDDSYAVPDGFDEYAAHAAANAALPTVPSAGPPLATGSIYEADPAGGDGGGEGEGPSQDPAGSGWTDDAYAVPEGFDDYVQEAGGTNLSQYATAEDTAAAIEVMNGRRSRQLSELPSGGWSGEAAAAAGGGESPGMVAPLIPAAVAEEDEGGDENSLLPSTFSPAPAPAPALASLDAVLAEEASLLPAFAPAPMAAMAPMMIPTASVDDLMSAAAAPVLPSMLGVGGGAQINADIFAEENGGQEDGAADDEPVANGHVDVSAEVDAAAAEGAAQVKSGAEEDAAAEPAAADPSEDA